MHLGAYVSADLAPRLHCTTLFVTCEVRLAAAGESSEGGTSDYMAPKQLVWYLDERPVTVKGSPTHHQGLADVYGLGMSLWRLLVAKDPSVDAEDPVLRVLRNQGQTPEEDSDFVALKLKQQLVSLTLRCVACICSLLCSFGHSCIRLFSGLGSWLGLTKFGSLQHMLFAPAFKP